MCDYVPTCCATILISSHYVGLEWTCIVSHALLVPSSQSAATTSATVFQIAAGTDFDAECLQKVQPGDSCYLEKGSYYYDGLTHIHGTANARITIEGDSDACIRGSGDRDRVFQIAHSFYTVQGICFDGNHGDDDYMATAIYVLGADKKSSLTHNGVTTDSSVTGLRLFNLEIKNFGSECIHFRYFVTWSEVTRCTIQHCGIEAFKQGRGGKVGEAIYVGTALDQVKDGKVRMFCLSAVNPALVANPYWVSRRGRICNV